MPPEPDINAPPPAVTAEVATLDTALDQVLVQAKVPAQNIIIGTWNLRAFSDLTKDWETPASVSPKRNFADVTYIASFMRVRVGPTRPSLLRRLRAAISQAEPSARVHREVRGIDVP